MWGEGASRSAVSAKISIEIALKLYRTEGSRLRLPGTTHDKSKAAVS
jgi:hypothetical protein